MSQGENEMSEQLYELAKNLSMELAIPLLGNPVDLGFATECVNAVLSGLNPQWRPVSFQASNQSQREKAWLKLFKIVQSTFLMEGEKLLEDDEQIGIENIIMLYQILSQGCEALRQQNMRPMTDEDKKNKSEPKNKSKAEKVEKKNPQKPGQSKKSKQNPKKQVVQPKKERPKTSSNNNRKTRQNNEPMKNLQKEVIDEVTKTMSKKYIKKDEAHRQAKIREKQGTEAVEKAKRTLDYAIKDYEITNRLNKMKKQKQKGNQKKDLADYAYMKMIENKHKQLNTQIENEQLKYYLQLRDKKVAYVRHIHKLIQKLQKERQIEFHKQQRQVQKTKKKQMIDKIEQVDNLFEANMQKLQQNYQNRKKVENLQNVGDMEICRAMEKKMKEKKFKEMEDMKSVWQQERNQLHKITTDEEKVKNRLIEIYRQYRV